MENPFTFPFEVFNTFPMNALVRSVVVSAIQIGTLPMLGSKHAISIKVVQLLIFVKWKLFKYWSCICSCRLCFDELENGTFSELSVLFIIKTTAHYNFKTIYTQYVYSHGSCGKFDLYREQYTFIYVAQLWLEYWLDFIEESITTNWNLVNKLFKNKY